MPTACRQKPLVTPLTISEACEKSKTGCWKSFDHAGHVKPPGDSLGDWQMRGGIRIGGVLQFGSCGSAGARYKCRSSGKDGLWSGAPTPEGLGGRSASRAKLCGLCSRRKYKRLIVSRWLKRFQCIRRGNGQAINLVSRSLSLSSRRCWRWTRN